MLIDRIDPIAAKREAKEKQRKEIEGRKTFQWCAEQYIAANKVGWKNEKHAVQWPTTLKTYAYPMIGQQPVSKIDTNDILKVLEPIWYDKTITAQRLRGRIETVIDWARARGYRTDENPAQWKGKLKLILPAPSKIHTVKHHAAMPYKDMPEFVVKLRQHKDVAAKALEFAILSVVRTDAARRGKWSEIDLENKIWTVPPERAKRTKALHADKPHRVALSDRAIEILKAVPREKDNPYVFIGTKADEHIGETAMRDLLLGMGYDGNTATVHGFRSTFYDWASEETNHAPHTTTMAMGHLVSEKAEAAYRRGDLLEKRFALANDWAAYCEPKG